MNKLELAKIKAKALENHIPIIMDDTLEVISKTLESKRVNRILEIGTAVGYSAICFFNSSFGSSFWRLPLLSDDVEEDIARFPKGLFTLLNIFSRPYIVNWHRNIYSSSITSNNNKIFNNIVYL